MHAGSPVSWPPCPPAAPQPTPGRPPDGAAALVVAVVVAAAPGAAAAAAGPRRRSHCPAALQLPDSTRRQRRPPPPAPRRRPPLQMKPGSPGRRWRRAGCPVAWPGRHPAVTAALAGAAAAAALALCHPWAHLARGLAPTRSWAAGSGLRGPRQARGRNARVGRGSWARGRREAAAGRRAAGQAARCRPAPRLGCGAGRRDLAERQVIRRRRQQRHQGSGGRPSLGSCVRAVRSGGSPRRVTPIQRGQGQEGDQGARRLRGCTAGRRAVPMWSPQGRARGRAGAGRGTERGMEAGYRHHRPGHPPRLPLRWQGARPGSGPRQGHLPQNPQRPLQLRLLRPRRPP